MTGHSRECIALAESDAHMRWVFAETWPRYCRTCDANGTASQFSFVPNWLAEPCPDCLAVGKCPRCAGSSDWDTICSGCGWAGDEDDAIEQAHGCICAPTAEDLAAMHADLEADFAEEFGGEGSK